MTHDHNRTCGESPTPPTMKVEKRDFHGNHPAFEHLWSESIETLNLHVRRYRHKVTGAEHIHLDANDEHNAFLVAFLTVPEDSTGVAHILEHTVLCGSERFPVRDPFFMMLRRSLSTFMNAFTSSDWTAYPFASQCRKDFFNLLDVYLDAAFFPRLDPLDFLQEGHRIDFSTLGDPKSDLVFKGVVLNEMKGAMSSSGQYLSRVFQANLFPTITYHHNSGGDPDAIPDLTHNQLKKFHARHYHPGNAVFMTYGDIPAERHQAVFEERVLKKFRGGMAGFQVPDEKRFSAPKTVEAPYSVAPHEPTGKKTHTVIGWLLGSSIDMKILMRAHLLNGVLLDNSASPLLHALETTSLGIAPSPLCGLDDSMRELVFTCGVEGSEPEQAEAVEQLVLDVLREVAKQGIPQERVASVLHQLELDRREIGGDSLPYGLQLMLNCLPSALHGGNPVAALAVDAVLEELRQEIQDPDFVKKLVRTELLDNQHRLRLVLKPDKTHQEKQEKKEQERLAALRAAMSVQESDHLLKVIRDLEVRQNSQDDPDLLPKVGLEDVPKDISIPEGVIRPLGDLDVHWYAQGTNGLVYQQMVMDLPEMETSLMDLLPLFSSILTEVGSGGRDYRETQAWQSAISGGIAARGIVRASINDIQKTRGFFSIASKALTRHQTSMTQLIRETFEEARFDELTRLREVVSQIRAASEMRVTDHGHLLAMSLAVSGMNPAAAISDQWGGMVAVKRLKALDDALRDDAELVRFSERLAQIRSHLLAAPCRRMVMVGEESCFLSLSEAIEKIWTASTTLNDAAQEALQGASWTTQPVPRQIRKAWSTTTQVNFCARAYPVIARDHPDAPILSVLGQFLKNGYLHRAIREKGGAYGSGAQYDSDAGAFLFFSYRDPRLRETLDDFDRSVAWLMKERHESRMLEEAILGVISAIDRPASPAGEAKRAFYDALCERIPEHRRQYRNRVLRTTMGDLKRVSERYLISEKASTGIISNAETLTSVASELDLDVRAL